MRRVLDTNVVLYFLAGRLAEPLPSGDYLVSVISELEPLSYPQLTDSEENEIRSFLSDVTVVELNAEVRGAAVRLRREHNLKLPDAIVCATAFVMDAELLTNDLRLARLTDVRVTSMPLKPPE